MKIIRWITLPAVLVLTVIFAMPVCAAEINTEEIYREQLEASGAAELPDALPGSTLEQLEEMGVSPENGADLSLSQMTEAIINMVGDSSGGILSSFGLLAGLTIFAAMLERISESTASAAMRKTVSAVISAGVCICASVPAADYISESAAAIEVCCGFDAVFIPVWSTICVVSGKAAAAAEYSTLMLAVLEGAAFLTRQTVLPLLRVILAVSLCSSLSPSLRLGGAVKLFEKNLKWILGFIAILVAAVMGLGTAAAGAMDEITAKTARFIISSTVPVVGGAMGDALSSVTGCVALLRTSVGGFGMIAMAFILLPALIKGALWTLGFNICAVLADMLGVSCVKEIAEAVVSVLSVMIALIIFTGVLTVFTLAVMLGRG